MKRITAFFVLLALCLPLFGTAYVSVQKIDDNPFANYDLKRTKILNGIEEPALMSANDENAGQRYILKFKQNEKLKSIYSFIKEYTFDLLAYSSARVFRIYTDDIEAFKHKCGKALEYCEQDELRSVNTVSINDKLASGYSVFDSIGLYDAWEYGFGSKNVTVAILDSGIYRLHEDFIGTDILDGYDAVARKAGISFDASGHGTKVAGIIASSVNNSVGAAGIAPYTSLLPVRIVNDDGDIYSSDFVDGLYFAVDAGANVINMSFGGYSYMKAEAEAIQYANENGCILVSASGNEGNDSKYSGSYSYPASYDHVISVGSCDENGSICLFSQYNDKVDVAAPGKSVVTMTLDGGYSYDSGTSFSTAFVSGAAALVLSCLDKGINVDSDSFEKLLENMLPTPRDDRFGNGIIDIYELTRSANLPIIVGVRNGDLHFGNVAIKFNRGTAKLDGEPFASGALCKVSGSHSLVVTDGDKTVTVDFVTDNLPLNYKYKTSPEGAYFTFTRGTAELDGFPYLSGDKINTDGDHTFLLTGPNGNTATYNFTLDYALPEIYGVEDGKTYYEPVYIGITGEGVVKLNDTIISAGTVVKESGNHKLLLTAANGDARREIAFKVELPEIKKIPSVVANPKIVLDEENNVMAVYGSTLAGIRIYALDDISKVVRFVRLNGAVLGHGISESKLLLFHSKSISIIERKTLLNANPSVKTIELENEAISFAMSGNTLFYIAKGTGEHRNVFQLDINTRETKRVVTVNDVINSIAYDEKSGCLCFADNATAHNYVYVYSIDSVRLSMVNIGTSTLENGILAENGCLCIGNDVYALPSMELVMRRGGEKISPLYFDGDYLITSNGVYNIKTGEKTGHYDISPVCICMGKKVYTAYKDKTIECSELLLCAPYEYKCAGAPYTSGAYETGVWLDEAFTGWAFDSMISEIYCINEASPYITVFDKNTLEVKRYLPLKYLPRKILYSEGRVFVSFYDTKKMYIYVCATGAAEYVEFSDCSYIDDFYVRADTMLALTKNTLCVIAIGTKTVTPVATENPVDTFCVNTDTGTVYVGYIDGLFSVIQALDPYAYTVTARAELGHDVDRMFADSMYLYVNNFLYDAKTLELSFSLSASVLARRVNALVTTAGLYDLSNKTAVGYYHIENTLFYMDADYHSYGIRNGRLYRVSALGGVPPEVTPVITGAAEGMNYQGSTEVAYSAGIGYIDGIYAPSGTVVKTGGKHTLAVVLPLGNVHRSSFFVDASLEAIELDGDFELKVNGSKTIGVTLVPKGSPVTAVEFSSSDNSIAHVDEHGRVTGIAAGNAVITAACFGGEITAHVNVTVKPVSISFRTGDFIIDRTNSVIRDIISGTTVSGIIGALDPELAMNTTITDSIGNAVRSGIISTGMVMAVVNINGEAVDSLSLSVRGDCDCDGLITVGDLLSINRMKDSFGSKSASSFAAADINSNGAIDIVDIIEIKEQLLGNGRLSENNILPKTASHSTARLTGDNNAVSGELYSVSVKLEASGNIYGICAKLVYDNEHLQFISASTSTAPWETEYNDADGTVMFYSTVISESASIIGEQTITNITFRVLDNAETLSFKLTDTVLCYQTAEYSPESSLNVAVNQKHTMESQKPQASIKLASIVPEHGELTPAFSPDVYEYVLLLRIECDSIKFSCLPENKEANVYVSGSDYLQIDVPAVFSIFCSVEDRTSTYTVIVRRNGIATDETANQNETSATSTVSSKENETNLPVAVYSGIPIILAAIFTALIIMLKKENRRFYN